MSKAEQTMICALLLVTVLSLARGIRDFDASVQQYEYIYHDNYDLLLVIDGNNCYYAYVADSTSRENYYLIHHRSETEKYVADLIHHRNDHNSKVHHSNLDTVRTRFHDILADFHCNGKNIYTIELDLRRVPTGTHDDDDDDDDK